MAVPTIIIEDDKEDNKVTKSNKDNAFLSQIPSIPLISPITKEREDQLETKLGDSQIELDTSKNHYTLIFATTDYAKTFQRSTVMVEKLINRQCNKQYHKRRKTVTFWTLPGGKVKSNKGNKGELELLKESALREFKEETGLDCTFPRKVGEYHPNIDTVIHIFTAITNGSDIPRVPDRSPEILNVRWIPIAILREHYNKTRHPIDIQPIMSLCVTGMTGWTLEAIEANNERYNLTDMIQATKASFNLHINNDDNLYAVKSKQRINDN